MTSLVNKELHTLGRLGALGGNESAILILSVGP